MDKFNFYEKWSYWRAMRKFPPIKECLKPEGQDDLDMNAFNWKSMRNQAQAEICLHHASVQMGDPEQLTVWLENRGFRIFSSGGEEDYFFEATWLKSRFGTSSPFSRLSTWLIANIGPFATTG